MSLTIFYDLMYFYKMGLLASSLTKKILSNAEFDNVAQQTIARILKRIDPMQIYIFGSYSRGEINEHSDLDLAIVFENNDQLKEQKKKILNSKLFLDISVDMLFYTFDDFNRKSESGGVCNVIKGEGKLIYDKRA